METDALKEKIMDVLNKHKTGKELVWGKIDRGLAPPVPTNALFIKCFNDVEIPLFKEAILELESEGKISVWYDDMRTKLGKALNLISLQQDARKRKKLVEKIFSDSITDDERFAHSAICIL